MRRCAYVKPDWNALTSGAGSVALVDRMIKAGLIDEVCHQPLLVAAGVAFAGLRFPCEVIVVAVRWYLLNLSYRDVEELVVQRGVEVDHVSGFRTYELDNLSDQAEVLAIAEKRRPYRSLATSCLFSAFEPTEPAET